MTDAPEEQKEMDLDFHTDMPVGEILRRTRAHYGQNLFQIEQVLRIRASQLEALEKGEVHKLPGRVYAIGFVRSYSEYLGLDGDKMVHLFKEQSVGRKQKKPELSYPVSATESKVPNLAIIIGSVIGVLLLIGFLSFLLLPAKDKNEIEPVPESLTKSQLNEAPSLVAGPVAATATAPAPAAAPVGEAVEVPKNTNRIVIEITDSSWIEIKNAEGAAVLRQVLKPGDIYLVPNEPGLILATGNAGGLALKVDGKEIAPIGKTGEIRRKLALDPDALLQNVLPPPKATLTQ